MILKIKIMIIILILSLSLSSVPDYERISKDCSFYCAQGGCLFNKCSDIQCPGGSCHFVDCTNPHCSGGACIFERCSGATCDGGGCTFKEPKDTLKHGYCNGHNCDIEGIDHPHLHGDEYLTF